MLSFFKGFLSGYNNNHPALWEPNCTCWGNVLLMYPLCHWYCFKNILEIGQAEGYTSWYLAHAAKENGGTYLAIDIVDTWNRTHEPFGYSLKRCFEGERLPCRFIQSDTKLLKEIPDYEHGGLDLIDFCYIDGEHKTDTILHEVYDLIMPKMRKDGFGILCFDDVVDMGAEGAWAVLCKDTKFEHITFHPNGGFGILRLKKLG